MEDPKINCRPILPSLLLRGIKGKLYICRAMKIYSNLNDIPQLTRAVVTIGSFDGVHFGHRKILDRVKQLARHVQGESVVITFHPHPRLVLYPNDTSLRLLTTAHEKVQLLEEYGIDHVFVIPFDQAFAEQTPHEYIEKFLLEKFTPRYIVIGYDHQFGKNREGNIDWLRKYEQPDEFEVVEIKPQEVEDIAISSTKIRKALFKGEVAKANHWLCTPYRLSGLVTHGQGLGRTLGFPTANLEVQQPWKLIPGDGIYAVYIYKGTQKYQGMLYIGSRPSIKDQDERVIEVNLFDFTGDLYGEQLTLEFVARIRGDATFDTLDALKLQLQEDRETTLQIFRERKSPTQDTRAPMQYPEVATVILNYNGRQYLESFLPALLETTYPNHRIIVADNLSTDDSLAFLRQHYTGKVEILEQAENFGFAGGYNQALQQVNADYYVLLNSDVEVTPGWLEPLIETMEQDEQVAACQPKIRAQQMPDYFEYAGAAGGWLDKWAYPFCRGRIFDEVEKDQGQYDQQQECFWATGAAMVIRPKLFHGVGRFDADYFAHLEEIDLCWRLKRAGYKVMAVPQSVVYHVGGGTLDYLNPRKTYLNFRNSLYTIYKNSSRSKRRWLIPFRLILDGLAAFHFLLEKKYDHIGAIAKAHRHFYRELGKLRKKRRYFDEQIQRVSIAEEFNSAGLYTRSIVWQFFARKRRKFSDLPKDESSI